jgi:hypothetical protein
MATNTDEESIMRRWCSGSENALSEAVLSEDGEILTLKAPLLRQSTSVGRIRGKSCQYTLASIYLQI